MPVFPPGAPTTFAPANIQPDLVFPFPDAATSGATANNQTFRSIIKPDLWGNTMRFRFSNTFGSQPLTFSADTVGLHRAGRHRGLTVAGSTFIGEWLALQKPGTAVAATRADKPFRPAAFKEVFRARAFGRKTTLEFDQRPWKPALSSGHSPHPAHP